MLGLVYMDDAWSMWCSIVKVEPCGASNVPECTVYGGELDMYCMYMCEFCLCVAVMLEYTLYSDGDMMSWVDFCR